MISYLPLLATVIPGIAGLLLLLFGKRLEKIAALESIIEIFLSDIRHRERSVFILCDNLVEMTCKK